MGLNFVSPRREKNKKTKLMMWEVKRVDYDISVFHWMIVVTDGGLWWRAWSSLYFLENRATWEPNQTNRSRELCMTAATADVARLRSQHAVLSSTRPIYTKQSLFSGNRRNLPWNNIRATNLQQWAEFNINKTANIYRWMTCRLAAVISQNHFKMRFFSPKT